MFIFPHYTIPDQQWLYFREETDTCQTLLLAIHDPMEAQELLSDDNDFKRQRMLNWLSLLCADSTSLRVGIAYHEISPDKFFFYSFLLHLGFIYLFTRLWMTQKTISCNKN